MSPVPIDLGASPPAMVISPAAVAGSPDGSRAYVASTKKTSNATAVSNQGLLQVIDVACNQKIKDIVFTPQLLFPHVLVISPQGTRAYVAGGSLLQVVDTSIHQTLGVPLSLQEKGEEQVEIKALAISPDGGRLYVAKHFYASPDFDGSVLAIDTTKLEQAVIKGAPTLGDVSVGEPINLGIGHEPTALAVTPDGSRLYVVVNDPNQQGEVRVFDATTLLLIDSAISIGQEARAIALTPDGRWAVVANGGSYTVSIIDTKTLTPPGSINLGHNSVAIAIAPDGMKAYVASSDNNSLSIIDLMRRVVAETIDVNAPQTAIALTPQGNRIYVITTDGDNNSLASIQIGARLPAEWNLTSGWVTPFCLSDPFHLIAVLGQLRETEEERKVATMPSALSQTVPVAESCPYEFSFWGIATEPDALAEVLWIGKDCGLLRMEQVPIQVQEFRQSNETLSVAVNIRCFEGQDTQLVLHRKRLMAPAGAQQAEIRFTTPIGVCAAIDLVSLIATTEAVANADLGLKQEGQLAGWDLLSTSGSGVTLLAAEGGIQLRNAGAETAELGQTIPVGGDQPFRLEFQGRAITQPSAKDNPRVELRWFKPDHSAAGTPVVLEITPTGLNSVLASGVSPTDASEAKLHLVVPPGTLLEIKRVSLRFSAATSVPVTFIAQAPGELTVSNWRVALERVEAAAPRIPEKGLCAPTPPGRQPGETRNDRCFCPCCESEQTMTETTSMETRSGRPPWSGTAPPVVPNWCASVVRVSPTRHLFLSGRSQPDPSLSRPRPPPGREDGSMPVRRRDIPHGHPWHWRGTRTAAGRGRDRLGGEAGDCSARGRGAGAQESWSRSAVCRPIHRGGETAPVIA